MRMISEKSQKLKQALFAYKQKTPPSVSVQEARARMEGFASRDRLDPAIKIQSFQTERIQGEWLQGEDMPDQKKVILFLHGGALIMGSAQTARGMAARLLRATGCPVMTLDYRLAPEHPFPAALEDTVAAYAYLLEQGYQSEQVILVGESAGGYLCAAALLALRDAERPLPAGAVFISPWLDLSVSEEERALRSDADPLYHPDAMEAKAAALYVQRNQWRDPLVSPVYGELHGLPPILIHAATDDVLFPDSRRFYDQARQAGVDIHMEIWEGMWHVWHQFAPRCPEAQEALDEIGAFVKYQLKIGCATRFCTSDNNAFP
jgi:acetyl esterase/lipase